VAVSAKSELRATLPATITQSNDFIFMRPLNLGSDPSGKTLIVKTLEIL
jgi:hypothetical protein